MRARMKQTQGFSLIEVLLAVATLTVGMLFIGGTFFLGLHYSTIATEKSIGSVVAQEAVNLIRLYGIDANNSEFSAGKVVSFRAAAKRPTSDELFKYNGQYRWDALCQLVSGSGQRVRVTVLVSRWMGTNEPELQAFTAAVTEGRFFSVDDSQGMVGPGHRSYVVSDEDLNLVFKVVRSKVDTAAGVRWELVPDPNFSPNDYALWTVAPPKDSTTQTHIVFVDKAEIAL